MDLAIAAWRDEPGDRRALPGVRAELLARCASAIQSGAGDVGELLRAAVNLMDRIGEGTVEPNEAVVAALGDAVGRLGDPRRAMGSGVDDLLERLDAYASGLTDFEFGEARAPRREAPAEPPLLTVRHDGVRVRPGAFEANPDSSAGGREGLAVGKKEPSVGGRGGLAPRKAGDVPPNELPVLVDAWEAIADHLRGQLESVRSIADTNADPELRRLLIATEGVVSTIERLNAILAAYARRAAP